VALSLTTGKSENLSTDDADFADFSKPNLWHLRNLWILPVQNGKTLNLNAGESGHSLTRRQFITIGIKGSAGIPDISSDH
jgi:hypothetical protein